MVMGVVLWGWTTPAQAQTRQDEVDYQAPNSVVQVTGGVPWLVGLQGEAWLAHEVSFELGVGTDEAFETFGGTWALRWRPDVLCIACGDRALVTLGAGPGGIVAADLEGGPWGFVAGLDLAATGVYWFSPTVGLSLTIHGGFGAGWLGTDFGEVAPDGWVVGGLGLAF